MTDLEQRDDVDRYHDIEARKRGVPEQAGDLADLQSVTPPTWGPGMWWRVGLGALTVLIVILLVIRLV
ncbi:MAG: hypothetical protein RIB53_02410 [Roseitalea porphyridii]|jgi:hypothetical protein|uniref:hypothetical protein n=1 Tax=Roseitalea porphyridii TaxID=1852022 RepID=UPI0032F049D7